jgi:hypothetical protein
MAWWRAPHGTPKQFIHRPEHSRCVYHQKYSYVVAAFPCAEWYLERGRTVIILEAGRQLTQISFLSLQKRGHSYLRLDSTLDSIIGARPIRNVAV